ncbi:hypothetical protein [Paenibacillus sp. 1A_MP2]|uniref:hypothetical protein n=1 Tax=Paenibacillus sp. 1A_MP2 TaxID=3457495 RepID=UPI003FCDEA07
MRRRAVKHLVPSGEDPEAKQLQLDRKCAGRQPIRQAEVIGAPVMPWSGGWSPGTTAAGSERATLATWLKFLT